MKVLSVDSICLWSQNPEKLAKFYQEVIGLPVDKVLDLPNDKGTQFKIGDVYFFVGYHDKVEGGTKDPYRMMVGFSVDSVKEVFEEISKKGVEFILQPSPSPDGTFYVTTALDPEGNIIQFFSPKP